MGPAPLPPAVRFARYVDTSGECHLWTGALTSSGYGKFYADRRTVTAHRWLWEQERGPVPDGQVLDHYRCSTRRCVNLDHCRPVSSRENLLRSDTSGAALNRAKEHCPQGHPYDKTNTHHDRVRNIRSCRICRNAASRRYAERKRQRAAGLAAR